MTPISSFTLTFVQYKINTRIVVFERTYILSYSRFQSDARQDEGVIFFLTSLTMEKLRFFFCFVLYFLSEEKKTGLA